MVKEYYKCVLCKEITIYRKNTDHILQQGCDCGIEYLIPTTNKKE